MKRFRNREEELEFLLEVTLPYIEAQAGAEHMLDGFGPRQERPIDKLVERITYVIYHT